MGKSKPRHKTNRRHNKSQPTGIPSVKETELEELELNSSTKDECTIQNIIEEIQSANVDEKLCGLQSLIKLAENPESVDSILKCKVLKIVAPLLIDKNPEVRNFTAGALRNLSASGSSEVCERLVQEDIMTPIIALLHQYTEWKPESSKPDDADTLLQVINILWNLCETDETALNYFMSANLLNILLNCLDYKTVGLDLSISVCQCLNSVSEDNAAVVSALRSRQSDLFNLLSESSVDNKLLLLRTLAAGLIVNLNPSSPWLPSVLAMINEVLAADGRGLIVQLSSVLPLDSATLPSAEVQAQLDSVQALVEAQTMALEILTNLTASQDDEMDLESDGSSDEEELNGWSEAEDTLPLTVNTEILEGLDKYKLVSTVFKKVESLPENVAEILHSCRSSRTLAKKTVRLQCRAFLCFNNLVSVVDMEQLGDPHHLHSLIKLISSQKLCLKPEQPGFDPNMELIEASTAAIRAILVRLVSTKFTDLGVAEDLMVLFEIGLSPQPRVQANIIRIVGLMGVILARNNDAALVKMTGNYLLESAEKQQALWLTAEALDSLMDMFAEDSTDEAAAEINLVPRLRAIAPQLKGKMRQERKTLGEHYPVVSTAMSNLSPFIKYKSPRVNNLTKQ